MAVTVFPAAAAASRYERTVFIKSTQSWTVPSDVSSIEVYLFAGGGGGGGAAGYPDGINSGGSGGATYDVISVTPGSTHTITIGAGGGGGSQGPGANGGTSSFGSLLSQTGGFTGSWSLGTSMGGTAGNRLGGYSGHRLIGTTYSDAAPSSAGLLGMAGGGSTVGLQQAGGGGAYGAGAGAANTGGGGGGGGGNANGGNGGSGLAILKYWSAV